MLSPEEAQEIRRDIERFAREMTESEPWDVFGCMTERVNLSFVLLFSLIIFFIFIILNLSKILFYAVKIIYKLLKLEFYSKKKIMCRLVTLFYPFRFLECHFAR